MKTGKKAGTIVVQENQIDQKEADLNQKNLTLNAPEGSDKTKEVLITNGKRTKLYQLKPGEEIPEGWRIRSESESKPEKLALSDVRGAYGMEMQSIKTRMLIDMTPEERNMLANLPPEQMLAAILGGAGKSLPADKKEQYINEIKQVDEYYGNLSQQVLGRKGVRTPKGKPGKDTPAAKGQQQPGYYQDDKGVTWHFDGQRWKYKDSRSETGWSYGTPEF